MLASFGRTYEHMLLCPATYAGLHKAIRLGPCVVSIVTRRCYETLNGGMELLPGKFHSFSRFKGLEV
jgi:hypothetical protein